MDFGMNARNYHWPQQPGKRTGRKAVGIPAVDAPLGLATMREKALRMPAEGNGKTKTAVVGGSGHPAYQKQGTPCVHSSNTRADRRASQEEKESK